MAQKKFTELDPVLGFLGNDDIIAVVQDGVSKQATISQIPVVGSSGTVTSVSIGNLSPLFTASVANSTTTPAISFALVNQNANLVYAGPTNGAAAAPSFRSLVAADIPDLSGTYYLASNPNGYTSNAGTVTSVSFTGGLISVANATTTPALTVAGTSGGIPYFSSASTWASSGALAANALMIGGGAGAAPSTTTTGTGVLTFLGTPSWTNFNSMITGTAPFWSLASGGTLTGVNTITSNAHSQHVFDGTWIANANNQNHITMTAAITTRPSQPSGEVVRGLNIGFAFTAGTGSNTANMIALNIQPSWNDNSTSGAIHTYIRCFDGTSARLQVTDTNVTIASSSNTLTFTNGAAGPQLTASSGSLQLNGSNVLMQVSGSSWFGVQSSNQIGASLFAVSGTVSSTATQTSSRRLNWQVGEWTGSASQTNYWTAKATQSTATNQLSYWDLSFGTTGSAPSETNLYMRVRNTDGNILVGATTNTSFTPNVTLDNVGGMATRHTTKSQITADQNDYAIGVQTAFRMSSDASRNVTGLTGGVDGKWLIISNVGAQDIVFTNEDAASTAANRITSSTGANITVSGGHTITFIYDATTSRWRDIAFR